MKTLIKFQKDRQITVKKCDKGAGTIVLNFNDYMNSCYEHLNSEMPQLNGLKTNYYKKVDESILLEAKSKINSILEEGFDIGIIKKEEFHAMKIDDVKPAKS